MKRVVRCLLKTVCDSTSEFCVFVRVCMLFARIRLARVHLQPQAPSVHQNRPSCLNRVPRMMILRQVYIHALDSSSHQIADIKGHKNGRDRFENGRRLNTHLPLSNHGSKLVRSKVHSVKVGQAVAALNVVDLELDLTVRVLLVVVQVSKRQLENAVLERVICVFDSGRSVDERLSTVAHFEH